MRFFKIISIILAVVFSAVTALFIVKNYDTKNPPVITCTEEAVISVPCGATDEDLLKYVNAEDKEDGNITDKIIVERKNFFLKSGETVVTFAVSDSDDNVSAIKRSLVFNDYEPPTIDIIDSLIIQQGIPDSLSNHFKITDMIDGDISHEIKLTASNFNALIAGEYPINCKASNSFGDSVNMDISVIVTDKDLSSASIKLKDYLIRLKSGDKFDFTDNIKKVINKKEEANYSESNVIVDDSKVDLKTPGTYNVYYTLEDYEQETVAMSRAIVIVE